MKVWVVTDMYGNVLGVFTTKRRAKACSEQMQREGVALPAISEVEVNDGSQDEG